VTLFSMAILRYSVDSSVGTFRCMMVLGGTGSSDRPMGASPYVVSIQILDHMPGHLSTHLYLTVIYGGDLPMARIRPGMRPCKGIYVAPDLTTQQIAWGTRSKLQQISAQIWEQGHTGTCYQGWH
jgi:hypothetical protein